ncbi:hypothetical protein BFP70_14470 [Thioclava sp. SK-1]|nr:hypothetical protein BFP70_14470 [Thioclava sp. SK-1]
MNGVFRHSSASRHDGGHAGRASITKGMSDSPRVLDRSSSGMYAAMQERRYARRGIMVIVRYSVNKNIGDRTGVNQTVGPSVMAPATVG